MYVSLEEKLSSLYFCFQQYINDLYALQSEIKSLPSYEHYDLLTVFCEEMKDCLVKASEELCHELLEAVIEEHLIENLKFVHLLLCSVFLKV